MILPNMLPEYSRQKFDSMIIAQISVPDSSSTSSKAANSRHPEWGRLLFKGHTYFNSKFVALMDSITCFSFASLAISLS